MSSDKQAHIRSSKNLVWLWFFPLIIIAVVAYIVWTNLPPEGEKIEIYFRDSSGINKTQTKLKYKGIELGDIEDISLTDDKALVRITLSVSKSILPLLKEGTLFWLVQPEIGMSGVSGINTLVTGPYITFKEGNGDASRVFTALQRSPIADLDNRTFYIKSQLKHNISPGDNVYYKLVPVGIVVGYQLHSDHIMFKIQIDSLYQDLVRKNSVFWEESGLEFEAGLFGVSVSTAPMLSLLSGGMSFATPEKFTEIAQDKTVFNLNNDMQEEWLEWKPIIPLEEHLITGDGHETSGPKTITTAASNHQSDTSQ